jgi:Zn-dependent peptidase ImmA (M78 family)
MMPLSIADTIVQLYKTADLQQPTLQRRIVLLNELLGPYNLTCIEIAGLTSLAASNFLLQHGAFFDPIKNANQDPLAGYLYVSRTAGYIFVERNDLVVRRRFSAAHELGHYLLHFQPLITSTVLDDENEPLVMSEALSLFTGDEEADDTPTGRVFVPEQTSLASLLPPERQMEDEANRFAAALLMPAEIVSGLVERYRPVCRGDDLLWRLATEMLVSKAAIYRRLQDLHLSSLISASWN